MERPLKTLLIEDNPADVRLVTRHLQRCGIDATYTAVASMGEITSRIASGGWDLVLSDFHLSRADFRDVLQLLKESSPDLPVILVSGTVGEERVVELLKQGVWDFVLKDNLTRLAPAIERSLRDAKERLARKSAQAALRESEALFRAMFELASIGMVQTDPQTGRWIRVNAKMCEITGYSPEEMLNLRFLDVTVPEERERDWALFQRVVRGEAPNYHIEKRYLRKDGSIAWVNVNMTVIRDPDGSATTTVAIIEDITERRKSQESQARLATAVEQAAEAIVITDRAGAILYVNPAFETSSGYTRRDVVGKNPNILKSGRHDEAFYRNMWSTLLRGEVWSGELINRRRDGALYEEEATISAVRDATGEVINFVAVKHDVSARKRAEAALTESEERFRELAANSQEVFYITDFPLTRMIYISPAYERISGRSCQSLYDKPRAFLEAVHPDDRPAVHAFVEAEARGNTGEIEYRIIRPDHAVRWIRDRSFPIRNSAGDLYRIAGLAEDITGRKELEEQFLRAQRLESIGQLASGIAHDLNNILMPVTMLAPLLRETTLDSRAQRMLDTIENCARRGTDVIKQILTFSRGLHGEKGPVQSRLLFFDVAGMVRETFPRSIRIEVDTPNDLWMIEGEAIQLHQVLMNLCVNSRDAMPEGGVIKLAAANTDLDAPAAAEMSGIRPGRYVQWTVSDTGQGIPSEHVSRIFDPFFTTKDIGKGTGLGLSTVLGIVKNHGGWIDLSSEPNSGATFNILLPAAKETASPATGPALEPFARGQGELILVVDDEAAVRAIIQRVLEHFGYRTLVASEGNAALELMTANLGKVRAMITDMDMPAPHGAAVIRSVRSLAPVIPIIRMSGHSDTEPEEAVNTVFLQKPFTPKQLLDTLRDILSPRPSARPLTSRISESCKDVS